MNTFISHSVSMLSDIALCFVMSRLPAKKERLTSLSLWDQEIFDKSHHDKVGESKEPEQCYGHR